MSEEVLLRALSLLGDSREVLAKLQRIAVAAAIRGAGQSFTEGAASASAAEPVERTNAARAAGDSDQRPSARSGDDLVRRLLASCRIATLGEVAQIVKGPTPIKSAKPGRYPLVVTSEARSSSDHFDFDGEAAVVPLVSSTGHGNASIQRIHFQSGKFAVGSILAAILPIDTDLVSARFIYAYLSAFKDELLVPLMIGTANVSLSVAKLATVPIPIIAKRELALLDDALKMLERLGAARARRESKRERFTIATFARLTSTDSEPSQFREDARFALDSLAPLTARVQQVSQLRQAIVDLAVRGRLSEQAAADEPASILRDAISEARSKAAKARGKKPLEDLGPVDASDVPLALPPSWHWVYLGDLLLEDSQNGFSRSPDDAADGIPILRISAGTVRQDGVVAEEEHKRISGVSAAQHAAFSLEAGDLLACRFNGNRRFVGRLSLYENYLRLNPIYPDKLIRLRLPQHLVLPQLIRMFAESDIVRREVESFCATTVGNWGISASNLKRIRIPLPPLQEQRRILNTLHALLSVCTKLEVSLHKGGSERLRLLSVALGEGALAGS